MTPFHRSIFEGARDSLRMFRELCDGLPDEAVNWTPLESGNSIGYPGSSYDNIGRFCYVRVVKKF